MKEVDVTADSFHDFQKYYDCLLGGVRGLSGEDIRDFSVKGYGWPIADGFTKAIELLAENAKPIYNDIDNCGEFQVRYSITESLEENQEHDKIWENFIQADRRLRNPDELLYNPLREKGLSELRIKYLENSYESQLMPILNTTVPES